MPTEEVDEFLTSVPEDARVALEGLRRMIRDAAPDATEGISYRLPTFKYLGHPLVAMGAAKNHCPLYVMSPEVMEAHTAELSGYDKAKGTVRFAASKPLPAALVTKLVKARIAEVKARWGAGRKR